MKLLLIWLCCLGLGCISLRPPIETTTLGAHSHLHKIVHIDPSFNRTDWEIINWGLSEWSANSNDWISWSTEPWKSEESIRKSIDLNNCSNHLLIVSVSKYEPIVKRVEWTVNSPIRGYFQAAKVKCDLEYIFLVRERIHSFYALRMVMLHEVGHSFGLRHNSDFSVMNSDILDLLNGITENDRKDFCSIWGC